MASTHSAANAWGSTRSGQEGQEMAQELDASGADSRTIVWFRERATPRLRRVPGGAFCFLATDPPAHAATELRALFEK